MLLCFDYDGVIADSFDPLLRVCIDARKAIGKGRDPIDNDFRTIRNLTFDALGEMIGIPKELCGGYAEKVFEMQKQGLDVPPFAAMINIIKDLASQHTVTVVTNSVSHIVADALDDFGIGKHVTAVQGGDSGITKSERIKAFQKSYDFDNNATYMIGDTIGDILAGKEAQVNTVAVTWGFQGRKLLAAESPDHLCDHPQELLRLMNKDMEYRNQV